MDPSFRWGDDNPDCHCWARPGNPWVALLSLRSIGTMDRRTKSGDDKLDDRHASESWHPSRRDLPWTPAFAGVTGEERIITSPPSPRVRGEGAHRADEGHS